MLSTRTRTLIFAVPVAASVALAVPAMAAGESKGDKAILKAGVITKADVPAEWTSKRTSGDEATKGIKQCKKINTAIAETKKDEPRALSRQFLDAVEQTRSQAENVVYAFSNKKAAGKFVSVFEGSASTTCFEALGAEVARNRPAVGTPAVEPITDLQGVGDQALGYEITINLTQSGGTATYYIDFVFVRVGRAAVAFGFANVGARIPQGPDIVNAVVQRVAAAEK